MANNTNTDWKKRELGALWKRKSAAGNTFLTGKLKLPETTDGDTVNVVVFQNKDKKNDNEPDFRVYLSEERQAESSSSTAKPAARAAAKPAPKQTAAVAVDDVL